jgi:hypothetical protein
LEKKKLFHRSKEEKPPTDNPLSQKEVSQKKHTLSKTTSEHRHTPVKEYTETLYSKGFAQSKQSSPIPKEQQPTRRARWENTETIEQTIDEMDINQSEHTIDRSQKESNTEKKVDYILLRKKKENNPR